MSQLLDEFWQAEDAAHAAETRVQALVDNLRRMGEELKNWRHFYFTGAGPIQASLLDNRNPMDATNWPTIDTIHQAMTVHAGALEKAKRAWDKVPNTERDRVHPPYWLQKPPGGTLG
jgi:hypothetical protein